MNRQREREREGVENEMVKLIYTRAHKKFRVKRGLTQVREH